MLPCVATIGFFDGVHLGHQYVIGQLAKEARLQALQAVVITFDQHPGTVLASPGTDVNTPSLRFMLTPLQEKHDLILQAGADRCEVLHFDRQLAALSAREFMATVLKGQLKVHTLLIGYDNRFGCRDAMSAEGFDDYVRYGEEVGIVVKGLEPLDYTESGVRIQAKSSFIRDYLRSGDILQANACLGRAYSVRGTVVHGEHIGTGLGFPTANIVPDEPLQLIPAKGVYEVRVGSRTGMMNIGTRPTYGAHQLSLEVHIFGFSGNLYGQRLSVSFIRRIREERQFASSEDLRRQLEQDKQQILNNNEKQSF